ncbi:MAG: lysozyme inhibitor LprI family protein [Methylobacter sp.]|nr:lysozyme inhibitor LprI family protein [Methylobacter sp.]
MKKVIIKTLREIPRQFFLGIIIGGFFLISQTSLVSAGECPRASGTLIPDSWAPSLDQLKNTLQESSKTDSNAPQQAMNLASQNLADVADAQLFILYIELMQTLDKQKRIQLFKEQERWLAKRAKSANESVTSKGGSLAPLEYSAAFSKITEERLVDLRKRLRPLHAIHPPKK